MVKIVPRSVARCLVGDKLYRVLSTTPERYETVRVAPGHFKLFRRRVGRLVTWGVDGPAAAVRRALARCGR